MSRPVHLMAVLALLMLGVIISAGRPLVEGPGPSDDATRKEELRFLALRQEDGRAAKAFCESPDFKSLTCGFASDAEDLATTKAVCSGCGTLFFPMPKKLPTELTGVDRYNQWGIRLVSLACKGPIVIRSVFKITELDGIVKREGYEGINSTDSALVHVDAIEVDEGGKASPVVRCELELDRSDGSLLSEEERAVKGKETKCWLCGRCDYGKGCPSGVGKWYSDTYTTTVQGCDFDPAKGYEFLRAGININPFNTIKLAKFEVCNNPGCFDAAYEQQKLKDAKPCIKGVCAA